VLGEYMAQYDMRVERRAEYDPLATTSYRGHDPLAIAEIGR
jgi:hypothetical protein